MEKVTRGYGLLEKFLALRRARTADKLIPKMLRSGRILDIGCGPTAYFLAHTKFKEKYGIDQSLESEPHSGSTNLTKVDIESVHKLPFPNNFFDIVTMLAVLEHLNPSRLSNILKEVRRILKPRGGLILTTPAPHATKMLAFMASLRLVSKDEINDHKMSYNKALMSKYLSKAGFPRERISFGYFDLFLNHWAYVKK